MAQTRSKTPILGLQLVPSRNVITLEPDLHQLFVQQVVSRPDPATGRKRKIKSCAAIAVMDWLAKDVAEQKQEKGGRNGHARPR